MVNVNYFAQLDIQSTTHAYPIHIGTNLLLDVKLLQQHVRSNQVLVVTNQTVAPLYLDKVRRALSSFQCDVVILNDGEDHKNQESLTQVYEALIQHRHHRDTTLVALGGGVIGDITGFAASTYQRGVRLIQLPTTLLAQVDSAIGGKTAINHVKAKNMIGSFHQPHAVIVDLATLSTLPLREFRAGFAEVIKYGLLVGGEFFQELCELFNREITALPESLLANIIARCCQIKATFIQHDERELGYSRVLLNLGHTFAHALEALTNYQQWLHGETVSIGLYCAALLSNRLGSFSQRNVDRLDMILAQVGLPRRIPNDIDIASLYQVMLSDKKIKNERLPFVLMRTIGDCYLENQVTIDDVYAVLCSAQEA